MEAVLDHGPGRVENKPDAALFKVHAWAFNKKPYAMF